MKKIKNRTFFKCSLIAILLIGIAVEISLHALGAVDFPIYDIDEKIGYMPKADQQGKFLNKNDWVLNNRALGTVHQWPADSLNKKNVMLIGDSIVWGGNPLKQKDKLGDQLEKRLGSNFAVWPASAGGWSIANEIEMIKRNLDIYQQSSSVIWFINSGDFSPLAESAGSLIHPNGTVICATCFYVQKYMLPKLGIQIGMENPPIDTSADFDPKILKSFSDIVSLRLKNNKRIVFVIYPNTDELLKHDWLGYEKLVEQMNSICGTKNIECIDLSKDQKWNASFYRDGIHPSVEGNKVLSEIISQKFKS